MGLVEEPNCFLNIMVRRFRANKYPAADDRRNREVQKSVKEIRKFSQEKSMSKRVMKIIKTKRKSRIIKKYKEESE